MQEGNLGYGSHFQGSRWQAKKTSLNIFQVQSFLIKHKLGFNNEVTREEPEKLTLTRNVIYPSISLTKFTKSHNNFKNKIFKKSEMCMF